MDFVVGVCEPVPNILWILLLVCALRLANAANFWCVVLEAWMTVGITSDGKIVYCTFFESNLVKFLDPKSTKRQKMRS